MAIQYGLIAAAISIAIVVSLTKVGEHECSVFAHVTAAMQPLSTHTDCGGHHAR